MIFDVDMLRANISSSHTLRAFCRLVGVAFLEIVALQVTTVAASTVVGAIWRRIKSTSELFNRIILSHLLSPLLLVFPLLTHDLVLHKFGQHLPPCEAHSASSLHFGEQVVTWE